jgi:glycosyltransferase involved in cell wall biosynthesis
MKILLVQDRLRGGGTERQTVFLARSFAAAGHSAAVLTFRPGGALAGDLGGITHRALQPFDTGFDWLAPRLSRAAAAFAPDVVLCMGRMANCLAGGLQRRLPGCAVVATVRTGKRLPWFYRRSLLAVRHIVANSEFARRTLVVPTGAGDRCSVILNALIQPGLLAVHPASDYAQETPLLLCVAQFRPEKGHRELLAIASEFPRQIPWRLVLAGDGSTLPACRRLAGDLGLAERIDFAGWQADPTQLYRRASVALLASSRESLPNFLVEAQCAGVPAVSFDVGGCGECFQNGTTGVLVPSGHHSRFAEAVADLIRNPGRRAAMAAAAAVWARERFSPDRQVAAYLDLFSRLRSR